MNILFIHRSFPAQFKYLATELAKKNNVVFITNSPTYEIDGIKKILYKPQQPKFNDEYLNGYELAIEHGKAAAEEAKKLKRQGFIPDVIYGHSGWGVTMFMKDIFPNVPLICYFEWFCNADGADTGFDGTIITEEQRAGLRCSNSQVLIDLYSCDAGISPTNWQKNQFPKEFHNKIQVINDGIDTEFFKPDNNAKFLIKDKSDVALVEARNLEICHCEEGQSPDVATLKKELTANDEVITYGTRGMEPYRGFPQFLQAVEKLLKIRPNLQVVIAGDDRVYYRGQLEKGTYKELMIEKLDLDLERVHFVGGLPYTEYLNLLQISSAHIYLTVPYVLSWSVLEAMSVGCCVVSSNTKPVIEVIKDDYNGLLADFYDIEGIVQKILYALDNKEKMKTIKDNARKTIIENYEVKKVLSQHTNFLKSIIKK